MQRNRGWLIGLVVCCCSLRELSCDSYVITEGAWCCAEPNGVGRRAGSRIQKGQAAAVAVSKGDLVSYWTQRKIICELILDAKGEKGRKREREEKKWQEIES